MKASLENLPEHLPFLWAEYQCQDGSGHIHTVAGDGDVDGVEGTATLLSEAVAACKDTKHGGHGRTHSADDAKNAYYAAVIQLINNEAEQDYQTLKRNIARYQKWGGPVPELVLIPKQDDPSKYEALITMPNGDPYIVPVRSHDLGLPDPREFGSRPHPSGFGWVTPKRKRPL